MIQTKEIQKWRIDSGVTNRTIAEDAGVTNSYVSLVVHGKRRSKAIIAAFIEHGCPAQYFNGQETK